MMRAAFFATLMVVGAPAIAAQTGAPASAKLAADIRVTENRNQITPSDSGDYIELAQAYLRAGRTGDAVFAYRAALARNNVMMVTRHGDSIWSHEIARMALARVPQLAAR